MANQSNALTKSKTPEQRLEECLAFGEEICRYYRVVPDPIQLSLDAAVLSQYPIESLRAAFVVYLASPKCDFPPKPGKLIEIIGDMADQRVPEFKGFTEADRKAADEAWESPEHKKLKETIDRICGRTAMPAEKQNTEQRRADLKSQAGRVASK